MFIKRYTIFRRGKPRSSFIDENSSQKEVFSKKKIFTSNLSRISWYGLLYQVYMLTNFFISSRTPCALITNLILGNSGFGNLVKLLNLRWPLNVIVIFYIFACKATKSEFHQVPFALV